MVNERGDWDELGRWGEEISIQLGCYGGARPQGHQCRRMHGSMQLSLRDIYHDFYAFIT